MLRRGPAITAGLLFAACAQYIAYVGSAGGDGWTTPSYYSPALFIAYPVVFARMAQTRRSARPEIALLALAALADLLFAAACLRDARDFEGGIPVVFWPFLWLAFWLFWQMLAVLLIVSRSGRDRGNGDG